MDSDITHTLGGLDRSCDVSNGYFSVGRLLMGLLRYHTVNAVMIPPKCQYPTPSFPPNT